jgi:hypothetical protein
MGDARLRAKKLEYTSDFRMERCNMFQQYIWACDTRFERVIL